MELHKRFILDIWKSAAYYDFQQSFKVPDTFYLHEKRVDWIFTGKNGKILKKRQDNSTVTFVKDFFCKIQKDEKENELNNKPVASQFLACYKEKLCYFHYVDLSGVCELLVNSFRNKESQDENYQQCTTTSSKQQQRINSQKTNNITSQVLINSQKYINQSQLICHLKEEGTQKILKEQNSNDNKELSDKTIIIQSFQTDKNENNMIKIDWDINGKFNIQKRINNYDSFRKENEYKKYIIFEDEGVSVNRELYSKEKQQLQQICQHVINSMQLIHQEKGKVAKLTLLLRQINNKFYLIACPVLNFDKDQSLQQSLRISYELKMKYPNKAIHIQNVFKDAVSYLQNIEKNKKVQQCDCCKDFSNKHNVISSENIIQIKTKRGVFISQYEANQLKIKDQCNVCDVCNQIFLDMNKISNQNLQNNLNSNFQNSNKLSVQVSNSFRNNSSRGRYQAIDSNSIRGGNSAITGNSARGGNSSRNKRSSSNFESSSRLMESVNLSQIENLYTSYDFQRNTEHNQRVQPREYIRVLPREYSGFQQRGSSSIQVRDSTSIQPRDYSSQRSSQRPPSQYRIMQKNYNSFKEQRLSSQEYSTVDTKVSLNAQQQYQNIYQKQFSIDIEKKSLSILNEVSNPYEITETSNQVFHKIDGRQSPSSKFSTLKTNEQDYLIIPIKMHNNYLQPEKTDDQNNNNQQTKTQYSPVISEQNMLNKIQFKKIDQINQQQDQIQLQNNDIQQQDHKSKSFKGKFGIKNALKNIKKDVKQQQQELKSVIQSAINNSESIQNNETQDDNTKTNNKQNNENEIKETNISGLNNNKEIQNQSKYLSNRHKQSSHSNRTGPSNQSTTSQSIQSHHFVNLSIENCNIKIQPNCEKQIVFEPYKYLKDLKNQNEETELNIQIKNDQSLLNQDKLISQKMRKSLDQDLQIIYQHSNNKYGNHKVQTDNQQLNRLDVQKIELSNLSQECKQYENNFLNNYPELNDLTQLNQQQINVKVKRSQSFKK